MMNAFWAIWRVSILQKGTLACRLKEPGTESLTIQLVDEPLYLLNRAQAGKTGTVEKSEAKKYTGHFSLC